MRNPHPLLPRTIEDRLRDAVRLEWISIAALASIIAVMLLTMAGSQAMRTAAFEDVLSLVPPLCFLLALRFEKKAPTPEYPYGRLNAATVGFLGASAAVLALGLVLLGSAVKDLATAHHPSIGTLTVGGHTFWAGWAMVAAATYSAIPPVILGRLKKRLASELNDDTLHADADMNKADWQTAAATIVGVLGVGLGFWWADAAAAALISLSILADGIRNLRSAVRALVDHVPLEVDGAESELPARLASELRRRLGVDDLQVRLREEGRFVTGEIWFAPRPGGAPTLEELSAAADAARTLDWRLHDLSWRSVPSRESPLERPWRASFESRASSANVETPSQTSVP